MTAESARPVPVAIVGMGCLFPRAQDASRFWANIRRGLDAIGEVPPTHWRPEDYFDPNPKSPDRTYARRGGFLDPIPFPALDFGITPNSLEATDTTQLLGLMAARQALEHAGYGQGGRPFNRSRTSIILGVTGTLELVIPLGARLGHPHWRRALAAEGIDPTTAERVVERIGQSYVGWQEESFPGLLGNVVAGRIANRLDLGGTNCVVDAACASSLSALHLAMMELAAGRCDLALSGGMDTFNDIFMYMCFSKTPALSPTGNARPFDAAGDGTILGEGLGCVVLKRLADAERDGDTIYAVLRAVGTSSDGKGHAIYAPSPAGQTKALRQAYELAGVTPDTIELVEAHGTGTKAGDLAEVTALAEVYGGHDRRRWCAIGSIKSQIGHTKAAAGAAGLIKAALALHHRVLPPTIKVETPLGPLADDASPFYVNTLERPWLPRKDHPRRAAVSSFGFGGSNYHCVLEEYTGVPKTIAWDGRVQIVPFAAGDCESLLKQARAWLTERQWDEVRREAARLRSAYSPSLPHRLVLVIDEESCDWQRLRGQLDALAARPVEGLASSPEGVYLASGTPGKLAFLFPGQGSQSVGMLRGLACQFPAALDALAEANDAGPTWDDDRLSDLIYPPPAFSDEARKRQEERLRDTAVAQPALGAVAVAALRVLTHFGVRPEATAGHSYGELCALHAAGCLDAAALHRLSRLRGQLMAEGTGDRGSMLAVRASRAEVESVLAEHNLNLVLANRNTPSQWVLSGSTAEIARAAELFAARKLSAVRLPVSAAFHSPFVSEVSRPLRDALAETEVRPASIPVYANTTAAPYPTDAEAARDLLANQLARPVEWIDSITAMHTDGVRTFVEVGAGAKLSGMVSAVLDGRPHAAVAVDASGGKKSGAVDLARVLAALAALGHKVDLARWEEGNTPPEPPKKQTLTVPICGANYVQPRPNGSRPTPPPPSGGRQLPVPETAKTREADVPRPVNATKTLQARGADAPRSDRNATVGPTMTTPPTPGPEPAGLQQALRVTQQGLAALQQLSEQTAQLHRQFLDGQDRALQVFQALLHQQQGIVQSAFTGQPAPVIALPAPPPPSIATPAPVAVTPPPPPRPVVQAPPPPAPAPAPVAVKPSANGEAQTVLLGVVSEKTGYPAEMLDLDMELDSDLGIDSIKRVEIFSAVQEKLPSAPQVKSEHLGTLRTLRQVVDFLGNSAPAPQANGHAPAALPAENGQAREVLLGVVSEKTGYPAEMLDLDMELDSDLGIDSIKRVEIFSAIQEKLPSAPQVKSEHLGTLRTLRQVIDFLGTGTSNVETVQQVRQRGHTPAPRSGLQRLTLSLQPVGNRPPLKLTAGASVWITADDSPLSQRLAERLNLLGFNTQVVTPDPAFPVPADLAGLVLLAPAREVDGGYTWDALRLLQQTGPTLQHNGSLLAAVVRLDGGLGLRGGDMLPTTAGLAGLVKTASHEWPGVACKVIDLAADWDDGDEAALALAEELLRQGPLEVGLSAAGTQALRLSERPQPDSTHQPLAPGDVVLLTGGARGVTAEAAVALAHAFAPTLVLLGRSPGPEPEPEWLAGLTTEAEIKRGLIAHSDRPLTPREAGERCSAILAAREIRDTLRRIADTGATAVYRSVDVRDAQAVADVVRDVRAVHGPVKGLIHGAGVLADRRIEDKTAEQFDRVYGTKVQGLDNLLAAVGDDPLRVLVLFSSSTGRFGRAGQVDYAAANEVLNKLAAREKARRPDCRVVALNWGPWEGGMVTPGLRQVFAAEGVGLIPLVEGGRFLVEEVSQDADPAAEVVVLAAGSTLPTATAPPTVPGLQLPPALPPAFERVLEVADHPVLNDHTLDGRPVLPTVLMLEWLAHAAMVHNPGLAFHGCDGLRVLHGVTLDGAAPTLQVGAGKATRKDGLFVCPAELRSVRPDGRETLHARAEIVLASSLPAAPAPNALPALGEYALSPAEVYRQGLLFHGPTLQGIETIEGCSEQGIAAWVRATPEAGSWLREPLRKQWLTDPLVLDGAFQLAILWSQARRGAPSLPCHLGRYRQYGRSFPRDGTRVVVSLRRASGSQAQADIDFLDNQGRLVARLEGYEFVIDANLARAFARNVAVPV